jgi:hypothetical protein
MAETASSVNLLPFRNVLAPPWMAVTPLVADVTDIEWDLNIGPFVIPAASTVLGTSTNGQQLQLDGDYDYIVREFQFVDPQPAEADINPQDWRVRIRDADGRMFTSDFTYAVDLNGPLPLPWPLRRGGVVTFDFMNVNASNFLNQAMVVLKGTKRAPCPGQAATKSDYIPLRYRAGPAAIAAFKGGGELEDFEYFFSFTSAGATNLYKQPLQTDNDADFLWRGITGPWNLPGASQVGNVALCFYDPNGTRLGQYPFQPAWQNVPVAGTLRECVLSNGGGGPNPLWPEVYIPRGGTPLVDISLGAAETVSFSLRGQKLYRKQVC